MRFRPAGTASWGDSRVWLEPAKNTNMLGRKKIQCSRWERFNYSCTILV